MRSLAHITICGAGGAALCRSEGRGGRGLGLEWGASAPAAAFGVELGEMQLGLENLCTARVH